MSQQKAPEKTRPSGARWVAAGMLSSRIFGLVREMAYARFLGEGYHTDVLRQAMKAPNMLQNLLGDQTMSAAFIPIYSRLLEEGREEDAGRFAGAVFSFLVLIVFTIVALGLLLAPWIVAVLSPGFLDDAAKVAAGEIPVDRYALQVKAVRFIFPMTGCIVLAAWAMGILNSHRRFFLPYLAPAFWNMAIVASLGTAAYRSGLFFTPEKTTSDISTNWLFAVCFGALLGGLLQFLVQVPLVWRLSKGLRLSLSTKVAGLREAVQAFVPALAGRGIVQLSLYVDGILSTYLAAGAPGVIIFASTLLNLPLGAFGMSVAAAELPELSRQGGGGQDPGLLAKTTARIDRALRQSCFLIIPSVIGYLIFGFLVVGLLYRYGNFSVSSQWLVWAVLASYTLGLLATTISRLLQNVYFALGDTKTPAKIASVRLVASVTLGIGLMLFFDRFSVEELTGATPGKLPLFFGACGLALAASAGAWAEMFLLLSALRRRIPSLRLPVSYLVGRFAVALLAAIPALGLWWWLRGEHQILQAVPVLSVYAGTYLGLAFWRHEPELDMWVGRWRRRR